MCEIGVNGQISLSKHETHRALFCHYCSKKLSIKEKQTRMFCTLDTDDYIKNSIMADLTAEHIAITRPKILKNILKN
jgi:hypothetical protein